MTTRRTGSRPRWSHGARPIRTRTSPAQGRAARLDVRAVSFIHWQVRLALVSPARGKHDFFLTEQPLMSGASIHHLEYLGLIRDEFVMRHRTIAIRVDLVHHRLGPESTGIPSSGEGGQFAPARADKFLRIDFPSLALVEHPEDLFLKGDPFILRYHAVAVRVDLDHHFMGPKSTSVAACCEGLHIVRRRAYRVSERKYTSRQRDVATRHVKLKHS